MGADVAEIAVTVETGPDARGGLIPTRLVRNGQRVAVIVAGQPWSAWRGGRLYVHYRVTDGSS